MKKIKFLGCAVLAAIMSLSFISCEKENYSVNGDINIQVPEAADAVVVINPSVIAFINGVPADITEEATINFTTPKAGADGTIAAQDVTITVTYTATVEGASKETVTERVVSVPELGKGMCCTITPTIYVIVNTTSEFMAPKADQDVEKTIIPGEITIENKTDYFWTDKSFEYQYKTGTEVDENSINWLREEYKGNQEVLNMINGFNNSKIVTKKVEDIWVYAQSLTIIKVERIIETTEYTIQKTVAFSRAADEVTYDVVKFNVKEYITTTDNAEAGPKSEGNPHGYDANINLKGAGHGHGHGHGNGHGHADNSNAGGGIVWGE